MRIWSATALVAVVVMVGSVGVGAWYTAVAVIEGNVEAMLVRFVAASLLGAYFLVLFRTARSQSHRRPPARGLPRRT